MNCTHLRHLLDAYGDGELDAGTVRDVDRHLESCATCSALRAERGRLAVLIRAGATAFKAPPELGGRVRKSLRQLPAPILQRPSWYQAGTIAALMGAVGLVLGLGIAQPRDDEASDPIVAAHVVVLAAGPPAFHLRSSDRHQIKPWFAGRMTFAPLVVDLGAEGFELLGARLDRIADRPTAIVVYRIRNHLVSVLMWRAEGRDTVPLRFRTLRGFAAATWSSGGIAYAAISDVEPMDLKRLAGRLTMAADAPP